VRTIMLQVISRAAAVRVPIARGAYTTAAGDTTSRRIRAGPRP
jgi:hypothetical protein